jgi:hypothetical protein
MLTLNTNCLKGITKFRFVYRQDPITAAVTAKFHWGSVYQVTDTLQSR